MPEPAGAEVFISYASQDRPRALALVDRLASAGVAVWLDRDKLEGATLWAAEIVRAIRACKVLVLLCSDASMRSWAVKQEIQLAGEAQKALLPLLLSQASFPEQIEFFLAGRQWIEVGDRPTAAWLPPLLRALGHAGVRVGQEPPRAAGPAAPPARLDWSLDELKRLALFNDQLWPVHAAAVPQGQGRSVLRGLGAPQENLTHGFPLGSRMRLVLESDCAGHLLLLDEGPEGKIYCLCPSFFAPDTLLPRGRSVFPQARSRADAFVLTGVPGREELLAIITEEPLDPGWMPRDARIPARVLTPDDVGILLARLKALRAGTWTTLATWFDVIV